MATYNTPATAIASSKQIWAVSNKFTSMFIEANEIPRVKWKIVSKRIFATLMHTNPDGITHGKIQEYFAATELPKVIIGLVKADGLKDEPKAAKAAPKKKAPAKAAPKAKAPAKAAPKPKAAKLHKSIADYLESGLISPKEAQQIQKEFETTGKLPFPKDEPKAQGTEARLTFLEETAVLQMQKIESIEDGLAQILLAVRG
jgi:hypothetical protein